MSTDRGRFVWYELMTTDPEGAQAFYTKVAEWGTQAFGDAGTPYTMWVGNGHPIGGVMNLPEEAQKMGAPSHWLGYIGTPDVDAATRQAEKMGATVYVQPTDIPTVGRFSLLADPQGATIAFFRGLTEMPPPEGAPGVGEMGWNELATTDLKGAWTFYSELFGWQVAQDMDMGPGGIYRLFGPGGQMTGGMYTKPAEMPAPSHWLYYINVKDLDAAMGRVKAEGGQILNGPMDVPGGRVAQCMDPQGAAFALHQSNG
jgi:predicted enzyme related to lactoylglutathione lyase